MDLTTDTGTRRRENAKDFLLQPSLVSVQILVLKLAKPILAGIVPGKSKPIPGCFKTNIYDLQQQILPNPTLLSKLTKKTTYYAEIINYDVAFALLAPWTHVKRFY